MTAEQLPSSKGLYFARWVFLLAGIYGLLVLMPQYFLEERINRDQPPPITHPEYFYGFVGLAVAWQLAFLLIGSNPVRFRPLILVGVVEKFSFGVASAILFINERLSLVPFAFAAFDLFLGLMFVLAYVVTTESPVRSFRTQEA